MENPIGRSHSRGTATTNRSATHTWVEQADSGVGVRWVEVLHPEIMRIVKNQIISST
jgi:hypothetical protein